MKENSIYDVHCVIDTDISDTRTIFSGCLVIVAQLVEVMESAVLGGVVAVVSSNPARTKNIFQHLPA